MSEEEEVLWETSARHLCFRCFFSQNFLTRLIADPRGFSEQAFFFFSKFTLPPGLFLPFEQDFRYRNLYCHYEELRLQAGKKLHDNFILC